MKNDSEHPIAVVIQIAGMIDRESVRLWRSCIERELSFIGNMRALLSYSSTGGTVSGALAFYEFLFSVRDQVEIQCVDRVDSVANIAMLGADVRWANPETRFTFHGLLVKSDARHLDRKHLEHLLEVIEGGERSLAAVLTSRIGYRDIQARELIRGAKSLTASQAQEMHLITGICGPIASPDVRVVDASKWGCVAPAVGSNVGLG